MGDDGYGRKGGRSMRTNPGEKLKRKSKKTKMRQKGTFLKDAKLSTEHLCFNKKKSWSGFSLNHDRGTGGRKNLLGTSIRFPGKGGRRKNVGIRS